MNFEVREENRNLIRRLENIVKSDKISHAYIFEGSSCIDKKAFVECFVKGILCPRNWGDNCGQCSICSKIDHQNHEDLIYIAADGSSVKDAAIIKMQERLRTKPFGDRHVAIIENSDAMTRRAQNRLLKTLEEPPGNAVIILLSENMDNLLQTVQSRCVKYRINYFGNDGFDAMMDQAEVIADMTVKREPFYKVRKEVDNIAGSREDTEAFLDALQMVYRNIMTNENKGISLYRDEVLMKNIHDVEIARKQIKMGVSPYFAVNNLLLKIGG